MVTPSTREIVHRCLLAVACGALLMFFFSPPWGTYLLWSRVPEMGVLLEVRRGVMVLWQTEHLGAELPDALHGAIQWRLLFPALGGVLHLPGPVLFGLAHAGCFVVLAYIVTLLRRAGAGWISCGLTALTLGATSWFFTSMSWLGYYDSWLVLGLLLVGFARSRWAMWAACTWAPWVDERFVLAAPLALLCRYFYFEAQAELGNAKRDFGIAGGLIAGFVAVRLVVLGPHSAANATVDGYLAQFGGGNTSLSRLALGIWTGLRLAWVPAGIAVMVLWRRQQAPALVLAAATVVLVGVGAATAQDLSRAMMLVFPVAMLGALWSATPGSSWARLAPLAAAAALMLPAHHVMKDRIRSVYYLHHELAAIDNPPPEARPELHELRGIQAMQRGDFVAAAEALSLAIKLAPNPASAAKQRGVLFASQQQWGEARKDFSLMVEHDPKDPDGWFLRAQAALALGDTVAARADAAQAQAIAPPGWTERPDVGRFFARLQAAK